VQFVMHEYRSSSPCPAAESSPAASIAPRRRPWRRPSTRRLPRPPPRHPLPTRRGGRVPLPPEPVRRDL